MRKYFLFFVFIACSAVAQERKMTASEIKSFRESVNAVSVKIKSMTTDFIQYKHLEFLSKDVETSGKMAFKEPDMLAWEYEKPYQYSIIFKKGKIFINDDGKKSQMDARSSKIFTKINKLIVGSVSGNLFDEKEFVISYYTNGGFNMARLVPKDAALKKYIRQIELTFDKKSAQVEQVRLMESEEDYTKIVFKNRVINAKVDDSAFNH